MSASQAGERSAGEVSRRPPQVARMLTWVGTGALRLEAARVVLGERGLRATGSVVSAPHEGVEPYSASYSLATDETGNLSRLTVRTIREHGEQHVTLSCSEEGIWLVDHGEGAVRTDFDGALDADLAFSTLFNALPVRRLGLHRVVAAQDLPVVFVALPSLDVSLVRQTYRTVVAGNSMVAASSVGVDDPAPGGDGTAVVNFASGSFQVDLTVDTDGLVLEYPGLARRI